MFKVKVAKAAVVTSGKTQRSVAQVLGCSELYLGRVLNGKERASVDFRRRLAEAIGCSEIDLFDEATGLSK